MTGILEKNQENKIGKDLENNQTIEILMNLLGKKKGS